MARPLSVITKIPILWFLGQHVSELHIYHFYFFQLAPAFFHVQFSCFRVGCSSARNYRDFDKIDILFFEHHVQAHLSKFWCNFIHKLEKVSMGHGCPRLLFLFHLQLYINIG